MTTNSPFSLEQLEVSSPCPASWDAMSGDDRVRFCAQCQLHVYDLSEMTRSEATELITKTEGRICGRLFRRADGRVITRDCPLGVRVLRRQVARNLVAIVALLTALTAGTVLGSANAGTPFWLTPLERFAMWIDPPIIVGLIDLEP